MSTIGTLTAVFDADTKKFDAGLRSVQTKIGGVTKDLGKATSSTTQLTGATGAASTGLSGMATSLSVAAGSAVIASAAVGGAVAGIYKLATISQELGAEIFDLSQKINFSAETLSSLKVAAELSGGSLASLSTALGIFDRNMEEAKDAGSEMAGVFKVLKIETDDNEKALRRAFTVLNDLKGGAQQTAIAMKLFGRSGKEVLGVIKETDGDVSGFIKRMEELGFTIGTDAAKAADKFGDELTLLQNQFDAMIRQIGQELVPVVSSAVSDISGWLRQNQGELKNTAKELANVVSWVYKLSKAIIDSNPNIVFIRVIRSFSDVTSDAQGAPARARGNQTFQQQVNPGRWGGPNVRVNWNEEGEFVSPGSTVPQTPKAVTFPKGGGGGKGGGGKAQKDVLEGLKSTLMGLNSEFRKLDTELLNSASLTSLAAEKEGLLNDVMSSLNATTKERISALKNVDDALEAAIGALPAKSRDAARALIEQALALHKKNETERIAIDLGKQTDQLTRQWKQDIDNARAGTDQYAIAIQNLEDAYRDHEKVLLDVDRQELKNQATTLRWIDISKNVGDALRDASNALGEAWGKDRWKDFKLPNMNEAATDLRQKWLDDYKNRIDDLASDITGTLDNAIYDGFRGGAIRGLASLSLGFLDMIQQVILGQLKNAIAEALTTGSAGGGGWLSKLLGFFVGAAVGGVGGSFGGAASGAGSSSGSAFSGAMGGLHFAQGGVVPGVDKGYDSVPAMLRPGEMVLNKQQQRGVGGTTNIINVTWQQKGMQTFRQNRSKREMAERIAGLLAT